MSSPAEQAFNEYTAAVTAAVRAANVRDAAFRRWLATAEKLPAEKPPAGRPRKVDTGNTRKNYDARHAQLPSNVRARAILKRMGPLVVSQPPEPQQSSLGADAVCCSLCEDEYPQQATDFPGERDCDADVEIMLDWFGSLRRSSFVRGLRKREERRRRAA